MKKRMFGSLISNDYIFSVFVKVMMLVVGVIHSAFLARFLGAELKGVAATITSSVSLFQMIITCGMHQAYPYFKRHGQIKDFLNVFINNVYFVYSVIFVVMVSIATIFRFVISDKIVCILILTPLFAYETIVNYIYLIEKPKKKNLWNLISSVSETVIIVLFWFVFEPNYPFMIIAISFSITIRAIASTVGLGVPFKIKHISLRFIAKMLRFGVMPMIALILTVLNSKIDILMLDANPVITSAAIGLYSVGIGVADKILSIPDAIREILLSKLVSGKNEKEVSRVTRISVILCTAMATVMTLLGKVIIDLLYGSEFAGAYNVLAITAFGTVFMVFLKMISQYNIVNKKQTSNLLFLAISVITNIVLNILLIPHLGIEGAAIASFVGHFVCAVCFIVYFCMKTGAKLQELIIPQKEDLAMLLDFKKNKT